MVHRLAYCAWNNKSLNSFNNLEIDHIDRNKINNNIDNLKLVNKSMNAKNKDINKIIEKTKETYKNKKKYKYIIK